MKNLSGKECCDVDKQVKLELETAGIRVVGVETSRSNEVQANYLGEIYGWIFERAWYYWIAKGPGIPPKYANDLHVAHGKSVRVNGSCECPSPFDRFKGFGIGCYHVDTQQGLNALADTIRKIVFEAREDERIGKEF